MTIEGAVDTEVFNVYVRDMLGPMLEAGDILVLDNLSAHKASQIEEVARERGAEVIWLAPYSPDFSPIELMWSKIKAALRAANFNVQVVEDPQSLIWGKLVINAAINPLTALLKVPNGELLERPSARVILGALAREAAQVALAARVKRLVLSHVSARYSLNPEDLVNEAREVFRETVVAKDGMTIEVPYRED